jgi:hypothetical protein
MGCGEESCAGAAVAERACVTAIETSRVITRQEHREDGTGDLWVDVALGCGCRLGGSGRAARASNLYRVYGYAGTSLNILYPRR